MTHDVRLSSNIFYAALALGLFGDLLLRAAPWGLNFFLWIFGLGGGVLLLAHIRSVELNAEARWLIGVAATFAGFFLWRSAPGLLALNVLATAGAFTLATLATDGYRLRRTDVSQYLFAAVLALIDVARSFPLLAVRSARRPTPVSGVVTEHARAGAMGLLIAVPLALTFGGLLMAADAVFEDLVMRVLRIDVERLFSHAVLTGVLAWGACGLIVRTLSKREADVAALLKPERITLGAVEAGIPLGIVNALFLAFVIVQLRYLFGDHGLVEATTGLTYSEYARRGFFELVAVGGLTLPLLLAFNYAVDRGEGSARLTVRSLSALQIGLVLIIMASALQRMLLYVQAYGLTELRLYATAFMAGLTLVLVWFCVTVLRGRSESFTIGAVAVAFQILLLLNVLNPDGLIVRVNASRAAAGEGFDEVYLGSLSADAVPSLLTALPSLDANDRCVTAGLLLQLWGHDAGDDWRSWNAARVRARREVQRQRPWLEATACSLRSEDRRDEGKVGDGSSSDRSASDAGPAPPGPISDPSRAHAAQT